MSSKKSIVTQLWDLIRLRIIDRYIIGKFLRTYFFSIAMIIVVVVIFDAAEKIDDFLESEATFGDILMGYYLNFIPFFVNQFSGLFTFIACIFFTSKMAYQTEIIAILSSGVSFRRFMYPYFVASLLITVFSLTLNLFVIPDANARQIEFHREFIAKDGGNKSGYERYIYRQVEPNTFAYIRDFNAKENRAAFFALETYSGGKVVSSLQAQGALYNPESGSWSATRYTHRTYDGDRDSLLKSNVALDTVINLTAEELGKVDELARTMNFNRLGKFIEAQKAKGSDMVTLFEIEASSRWAYPFSTFVLTLIGLSLSSRKVRGGTGLHIGLGIGLCFSYVLLMRFASEFAKGGIMPADIAIWAPNILYFIIGVYLYIKAPK